MADAWELEGEGSGWSPRCSRQLNDCELPEVESFFRKLHSIIIKKEMEDSLRWNESNATRFQLDLSIILFQGAIFALSS